MIIRCYDGICASDCARGSLIHPIFFFKLCLRFVYGFFFASGSNVGILYNPFVIIPPNPHFSYAPSIKKYHKNPRMSNLHHKKKRKQGLKRDSAMFLNTVFLFIFFSLFKLTIRRSCDFQALSATTTAERHWAVQGQSKDSSWQKLYHLCINVIPASHSQFKYSRK